MLLVLSVLLGVSLYHTMDILPISLRQGQMHPFPTDAVPKLYPRQHGGKSNERIKVVIFAKHKTGSTMSLDMFKKHGDFYTVFEPLNYYYIDQIVDTGTKTVNLSLNCNFEGLDHTERKQRNSWVRNRVMCPYGIKSPPCYRGITSSAVGDICRNSSHIAVKVIVMRRIQELYPLMEDGVKVIHLLRDPRGMINSRLRVVPNLKNTPTPRYEVAEQYCHNALMDLWSMRQVILANPRTWKSSYYLLRYEDLATQPNKTVHAIYQMLGLTPDKHVQKWLSDMESQNRNNDTTDFVKYKRPFRSGEDAGHFRSRRRSLNPRMTSQKWRWSLSWENVHLVQRACDKYMDILGYRPVDQRTLRGNVGGVLLENLDLGKVFGLWYAKYVFCQAIWLVTNLGMIKSPW